MPATKRDHVPDGHERPHARGGTFGVQQHDWPMRSARARQRKIVVRQDFARATRGRAQKIKERRVAFAWQQRGIRTVLMHFTVKTATISPLLVRKCSGIEGVELLAGAIRDFVYVLSGLVII